MIDIDHFKQINDKFGHSAGDKALQIVAKLMLRDIRKTDFLFRIGGEEFVLLLPKTSLASAAPLVEKLRRGVGKAGAVVFHPHFDEPTLGVDVQGKHVIWERIREQQAQGKTFVVSTNDMAEAEEMADRVAILLRGRIAATGSPLELTATGSDSLITLRPISSTMSAIANTAPTIMARRVADTAVT